MNDALTVPKLYKDYLRERRLKEKKDPAGLVIIPLQEIREPLLVVDTLYSSETDEYLLGFVDWAHSMTGVVYHLLAVPGKLIYPAYLLTDFPFTSDEEVRKFVKILCVIEEVPQNKPGDYKI